MGLLGFLFSNSAWQGFFIMLSGNLGFKLVCHLQNGNGVHWKKEKRKPKE
jgi:hypothetical protein